MRLFMCVGSRVVTYRRDKFRAEAIRFYLDKRGLVVSTDGL